HRSQLARGPVSGFGRGAMRAIALWQRFLDLAQPLSLGVVSVLQVRKLALELLQPFGFCALELGLLVLQPLAALFELRQQAQRMFAGGGLYGEGLLAAGGRPLSTFDLGARMVCLGLGFRKSRAEQFVRVTPLFQQIAGVCVCLLLRAERLAQLHGLAIAFAA